MFEKSMNGLHTLNILVKPNFNYNAWYILIMDYEFYALSAYNKLSEGWPLRSRSTLDSLYLVYNDMPSLFLDKFYLPKY